MARADNLTGLMWGQPSPAVQRTAGPRLRFPSHLSRLRALAVGIVFPPQLVVGLSEQRMYLRKFRHAVRRNFKMHRSSLEIPGFHKCASNFEVGPSRIRLQRDRSMQVFDSLVI